MGQLIGQAVAHEQELRSPLIGTVFCSIIVPVYDEEDNLPLLHSRITEAMQPLGATYEIIYVDDGSRDASFTRLSEIAAHDPNVVVVQFRRNFGQTAALAAGIAKSCGDNLVFMDADLQNDPADIPQLLEKLEQGFDVVSGWRVNRQDAAFSRKLPSRLANGLISAVTGVHLHDYGCTLKAYRREVVEHIELYGEMHRFIPAHAAWVGATITEIPVQHHPRIHGKSKYGIARTLKVILDLLTVKFLGSYSTKPIYIFGGLGLSSIAVSFVSIAIATMDKLLNGVSLIQSPLLLLTAMLFIIGVQLVLMGFIAEIGVRTYHESQSKPTYVVRRVVRHEK
ncbi:MAG: glycosyltransferase family 2 protein [Chloroflexi bacterium]|nr:glycosyltransferase family 2 protein [Chloroflexota bacterium]